MAGFLSSKTKRKDFEEVYDDFSEFSLSSPARKIRRLDADLPPIMEEEDPSFPLPLDQQPQVTEELLSSTMIDVEPTPLKEERAMVLYKPVNNPLVLMPSSGNVSISMNSELVQGLKNHAFWQGYSNSVRIEELPLDVDGKKADALAVVPWVQAQVPSTSESSAIYSVEEPMDAEDEGEGASMEVEVVQPGVAGGVDGGFHQWQQQQQHCMIPQPS